MLGILEDNLSTNIDNINAKYKLAAGVIELRRTLNHYLS